jgi:outer membrane lipoprotein-sorting protein
MKKILISLCCIFLASVTSAGSAENNSGQANPLTGSWVFNIVQAPQDYSRGKVIFEVNKENVITGKILFNNGAEIKINKITQQEEKVTFEIIVDGSPVKTILSLVNNEIKGYVQTYDGNIPFSAKKELPVK